MANEPIEKIYEDVQLHIAFSQAASRSNIVTYDSTAQEPENISTAFGKLSKWYEALVPTGGSSGKILAWNSSGTAKWSDPLHPTITKSADTTSTASPAHGGTFTTVDSVTRDANGHVTKINTKTVTLPADSNTDTLVSQTFATASNKRPLLMSYYKVGEAAGTAQVAYRNDSLYCNPSNGRIFATGFYTSGWDSSPASTSASLQANGLVLRAIKTYGDGHTLDYNRYVVRTYSGKTGLNTTDWSSNGMLVTVEGGGLTIVGGGESAASLASLISDDYFPASGTPNSLDVNGDTTTGTGYLHTSLSGSSENLILSADTEIYFVTNANTIANRKAARLTSDLYFAPLSTNTGSIGTSTYQWNTIFGKTIYENGTSLASKYEAIGHTHTTTIATDSGTNQLTLAASTKYKLTAGGTNFIFTTPPNTTYSAGAHLSLSSTTFSLASYCKSITDWNSATTNGWYMGSSVTNAPSTAWWFGRVVAHNAKYCLQEVWNFSVSAPDNTNPDAMYMSHKRRWFRDEKWGPWVDVSTPTPSAKVNCDFSTVASRTTNVTRGWMAYWDGSYNGSSSNLTYCNQGAFGTIVTKNTGDYVPNTQAGVNAAINLLSTGSSNPTLADYYISQYAGGGTTTTSYHRRPISALWNTFKGLITLETTGSGNAVTAVSIANDGDNNRKITVTKGTTFSTTDEKVKVDLFTSTTSTDYMIAGATAAMATTAGHLVIDTADGVAGARVRLQKGTTSVVGQAMLMLGNNIASGTAKNMEGSILMYASTAKYGKINMAALSDNRTWTMPDKTGTVALTSDIPTVNNASLTLKGAGTTVTTFTANASTNQSLNIAAGTNVTVTPDATNHKITIASSYTNTTYTFATGDAVGQIKVTPSGGSATNYNIKGINAGTNSGTAKHLAYYSDATTITYSANIKYSVENSTASTPRSRTILHLFGAQTVGNDATALISGTKGVLSYGDGGPQINFSTSGTIGGAQDSAIIWTDNDSAATGASWHFVSSQSDWNVISKRFHARTGISIGTDLPQTSYNLYVNGTTFHSDGITFGSTTDIVDPVLSIYTRTASNYNTAVKWSNGSTWGTYGAEIGYHNTGGDSTNPGTICILPYQTETNPWGGQVGLFIKKDHVYIDGTELSKSGHTHSYIPLSGSTSVTGKIGFSAVNTGIWLKDASGIQVGALVDNGSNLWIGAGQSTLRHHKGETFISSGWSGTLPTTANSSLTGNETIKISVPKYTVDANGNGSWNHTGYPVLHSGNYTSYTVKKDGTGATGSWGISITGNAATATTAANADVTVTDVPSTSTTTADPWYKSYGLIFAQNPNTTQANTLRKSHNLRFYHGPNGTADTVGVGELVVGNNTASGTAGNMQGRLVLYSSSSSYHTIVGAATSTARTITIPAATGSIILGTKGSTSYYGLIDGGGSTSNWIRGTSNGFLPSASAKFFQTATSSLGTSTWYFKNSYIQNMTSNKLVLGAAKTADGAQKGQLKFYSGNSQDVTGTVTLECVDDAAHPSDYTVKLPTCNGALPVFEKLFDNSGSASVSLSFDDIDDYDMFFVVIVNSNSTTEPCVVASTWISNAAGVHDMPLIYGGAPNMSGGSCNVTSAWIQLSKNSGTTTFIVAHKQNIAQMTSSGWTISSPTYNLYIRKIYGLKAFKRT